MALYLKPITGNISLKSLEKFAFKRMRFLLQLYSTRGDRDRQLEVLSSAATAVDADCLIQGCAKDSISHFILRLLLSRDAELREFFLTTEVDFFGLRLGTMSRREITSFFTRLEEKVGCDLEVPRMFLPHLADARNFLQLMVQLRPQGETWKSLINKFLQGHNHPVLSLPWTGVMPLVACREVGLCGGIAQVGLSQLLTSLTHLYAGLLCLGVSRARRGLCRIHLDPRMTSLQHRLKSLWRRHFGKHPPLQILRSLRCDQVDAAVQWFPPCMAHLHQQLCRQHRLHHHDRIQYTLFLKEAGMSVEGALGFWRREYSVPGNGSSVCGHGWERDERRYTYSIRHLYGLQGSKTHYHGHSCRTLQTRTPGPQQHGGCPFVHFDLARLRKLLSIHVTTSPTMDRILALKQESRFSQACSVLLSHRIQQKMAAMTTAVEPAQIEEEMVEDRPHCTGKVLCRENGCGDMEEAGRGKVLDTEMVNRKTTLLSPKTLNASAQMKEKEKTEEERPSDRLRCSEKTLCSRNSCKDEHDATGEKFCDIEEIVQVKKSSSSPRNVARSREEEMRESAKKCGRAEAKMELQGKTFPGSASWLSVTDKETSMEKVGCPTGKAFRKCDSSVRSKRKASTAQNTSPVVPVPIDNSNRVDQTGVESRSEVDSMCGSAASVFADCGRAQTLREAGSMEGLSSSSVKPVPRKTVESISRVEDVSNGATCPEHEASVSPTHLESSALEVIAMETGRKIALAATVELETSTLCLKDVFPWTDSSLSFSPSLTPRQSIPCGGGLPQENLCGNGSRASSTATPEFLSVSSALDLFEGSQHLDITLSSPSPSCSSESSSQNFFGSRQAPEKHSTCSCSSDSSQQFDRALGSRSPTSSNADQGMENILEIRQVPERNQTPRYSSDSDIWSRHSASDLFDTDSSDVETGKGWNQREPLHPRPSFQDSATGWRSEEDLFEDSQLAARKWFPPSPLSPSENSLTTHSSEDLFGEMSEHENEQVSMISSPDRTVLAASSGNSCSEEDGDETMLNCSQLTQDCAVDVPVGTAALEESVASRNTVATVERSPRKSYKTGAKENAGFSSSPVDENSQAIQKLGHQPLRRSEASGSDLATEWITQESKAAKPGNKRPSSDCAEDAVLTSSQVKCLKPRKRRKLFASAKSVLAEMDRQEGDSPEKVRSAGAHSVPQTTELENVLQSSDAGTLADGFGVSSSHMQQHGYSNDGAGSVLSSRHNQRNCKVTNGAFEFFTDADSLHLTTTVLSQNTRPGPSKNNIEPEDVLSLRKFSLLSPPSSSSDRDAVSCKPKAVVKTGNDGKGDSDGDEDGAEGDGWGDKKGGRGSNVSYTSSSGGGGVGGGGGAAVAASLNHTFRDVFKSRVIGCARSLSSSPRREMVAPPHLRKEGKEGDRGVRHTMAAVRKPVDFYASFLRLLEGLSP